jgi:outer membrane protein assembly factor BamB
MMNHETLCGRRAGRALALAGVAIGIASMGGASQAADWPGWRGASRNGASPETGLNWAWPAKGPKVLWRATVGKGFSSFAAAAGRVYTMGNTNNVDTVFCFDAETGRAIWQHHYDSELIPLSYEGGPSSTPLVADGRVYTLGKSGRAFCLEAETGRIVWTNQFAKPPTTKEDYGVWWGYAGSPLAVGDHVIFTTGITGSAFDKKTGAARWQSAPGRPGYASPVPFVSGAETCYAFLSGHELVAAKAATGEGLWKTPWRTTWDQNAPDVLIDGTQLFVSSGHNVGCALFELSSGQPVQIWRNKNLRNELASSVLYQGRVYGFDAKQLACVDWKTGDRQWVGPENGFGSLILADGKLLTLLENGTLQIVNAASDALRVVAQTKVLDGRCWTAPALADGRLFLRNAAGDVVGLDLRAAR